MSVHVMVPTDEELARAAELHSLLLPGNNDDGEGDGWLPTTPAGRRPEVVVLVAVEDDERVCGYVLGDSNVDGIAVCLELAVLPETQGRGIGTTLLRRLSRYAIEHWASEWIYLDPLNGELASYYRSRGFENAPDPSGYLRSPADRLATRS